MYNLLEHTRRPDISFNPNGRIRIMARAARLLALHPGDIINIAVRDGEYLLHATHSELLGRHEAQCYPTQKGSENYCANSVRLCRSLFNALEIEPQTIAFHLGDPIVINSKAYIPIITHNPL